MSSTDRSKKTKDLNSAQKPWKIKKKPQSNVGKEISFEIMESPPSKVVNYGIIPTQIENYTTVRCENGVKFVVPTEVVKSFTAMDIAFSKGTYREYCEESITFPDINSEIMEITLRYAFQEYVNKLKDDALLTSSNGRTVFQFEIHPAKAMSLISTAHYLGQTGLLSLCTTMVARHMADVPDVRSLPGLYAESIVQQMKASELLEAEERPDLQSLKLDTEPLWQRHFEAADVSDVPPPDSNSASDKSSASVVPASWKSAYVTHMLQERANSATGSASTTQQLLSELRKYGKFGFSHRVLPSLYADVISPLGDSGLVDYLSHFMFLTKLTLCGLPLAENPDILGSVLSALPCLQVLVAVDVGLDLRGARKLAEVMETHSCLWDLNISENKVGSEGLWEIFRKMPGAKPLRCLNVSDNAVQLSCPDDALTSFADSALEAFICDGAEDYSLSRRAWNPALAPAGPPDVPLTPSFSASPCLMLPLLSAFPRGLKKLSLMTQGLGDSQTKILTQALEGLPGIQDLNLGNNRISSRGAMTLFQWLRDNSSLKVLGLGRNKIDNACVQSLLDVIRSHPCISKINLMSNYQFGDEGFLGLVNAIVDREHAFLQDMDFFELDVRETSIRDAMKRSTMEHLKGCRFVKILL